MSLEQMSRGIVNKQADMYSFGMTIYEVCWGNAFWHEFLSSLLRSSLALLRFLGQLMASPLLPWLEVSARLGQLTHISFNMASIDNDDLWSLITCCWSSDHDLRPTAADVALMLHRLLASQFESPLFSKASVQPHSMAGLFFSWFCSCCIPPSCNDLWIHRIIVAYTETTG